MEPTGVFNNYYRNKRVIVTGHTGFKGSWLSLWLAQLGASPAGFSAYLPSNPCNFEALGLERLIKHHKGDIRNFHQLNEVFQSFHPEIVFHLAAQPLVRRSYEEPKLTFDTNVGGTVNVLECIRQNECVKAAVIITSDKCYKNVEWVWGYRENDQLGGDDPYSASKGCAEIAIHSYCQSYFSKENRVYAASTRAGNVIGGGDWAEDRIIPDCVRAWAENQPVIIRNPCATRPWQYVLEPLSGYLWLGALLGSNAIPNGEAFNFGPRADTIQPVSALLTTFQKYWDKAQWKVNIESSGKKESSLLKLCCDKSLSLLKWNAILSFEEAIEFTALWYKKFLRAKENMLEFSKQQIEQYCSLAKQRGMEWAKDG
jgi:CDP-glucose 4,6-dehydratase